jgi:flagellar basal body-associated protein FliL
MAEQNPQTTPTSTDGAPSAAARKPRSFMLPLIVTAVASAGLGAGVVFLLPARHPEQETERKQEVEKKALEPRFSGHVLELMFNPNEKRRARTCRMNMMFQFVSKNPDAAEKLIGDHKEQAKSELLIYLSDRRVEEVQGSENLTILRRELRQRLERIFFPKGEAVLHDVLFTDVLLQ